MRKIDLGEITNNKHYAEVAYLVDNDSFLDEVDRVRKLIGIDSPLKYQEAGEWLQGNTNRVSFSKMTKKEKEKYKKRLRLSIETENIKERFKKRFNYSQLIKYAILAGKVTDNECTTTTFCVSYPFSKEFNDAELYVEQPMVAIFVNPETKFKEVKKLMDTRVKKLFDKTKRIYTSTKRERTNIERDRDWYWENHPSNPNRLGYGKIADKHMGTEPSTVRQAIDQYKKDLAMHV